MRTRKRFLFVAHGRSVLVPPVLVQVAALDVDLRLRRGPPTGGRLRPEPEPSAERGYNIRARSLRYVQSVDVLMVRTHEVRCDA